MNRFKKSRFFIVSGGALKEAIEGYRTIGMPRHLEMAKELIASL